MEEGEDLVWMLREAAKDGELWRTAGIAPPHKWDVIGLLKDAAEEIERLRASNERLSDLYMATKETSA